MAKEIAKLVGPIYSTVDLEELEEKFRSGLVEERPRYQITYGGWLRGTNARVLVVPVAWYDPELRYAHVGNYTGPPLFFDGLPPWVEEERYRKLEEEWRQKLKRGEFAWSPCG
jgi:hypothetical protein